MPTGHKPDRKPRSTPSYSNRRIINALKRHNGYLREAAKDLGCDQTTIMRRAKKHPSVADQIDYSHNGRTGSPRQYTSDAIIDALKKHKGCMKLAAEELGCTVTVISKRGLAEPAVKALIVRQPHGIEAGCPKKATDEQIAAALHKFGGTVVQAARSLGYASAYGVRARIKQSPMLSAIVKEHRSVLIDDAESVVSDAVSSGDIKAAQFVLSRLGKDRGWTERREVANAHLHVHAATELTQGALEKALAERLGVEHLPESSDELSTALEAEFTVVEPSTDERVSA